MILDLHCHSKKSEDGRASVLGYLRWLAAKRDLLPIDGIVLTEHRQFDDESDYRALEDEYGVRILKGSELETNYGHVLVFGVNDAMRERFDFTNVRLDAQELVAEIDRLGGVAVPCHPGRATIGLWEHYQDKPPLEGVRAIELLNGGSRGNENERAGELAARFGYRTIGGSDAHLVSFIGLCATEFAGDVRSEGELVEALRAGDFRPVDYRDRLA